MQAALTLRAEWTVEQRSVTLPAPPACPPRRQPTAGLPPGHFLSAALFVQLAADRKETRQESATLQPPTLLARLRQA